jgi:hypothetical protein
MLCPEAGLKKSDADSCFTLALRFLRQVDWQNDDVLGTRNHLDSFSLSFSATIFLLHEDSLFEESSIVSQGLRTTRDTHISFIQCVFPGSCKNLYPLVSQLHLVTSFTLQAQVHRADRLQRHFPYCLTIAACGF